MSKVMNSAKDNAKPNEDFHLNHHESQSCASQESLGELHSGRKSPALSIVSTASSGSPLIRSGSVASKADSGAGLPRRPAPTSIAAAQLQQQQQQQQLLQHGQTNSQKKHSAGKFQSGNKLAQMAKMAAASPSQTAQFEQQAADLDQRLKGPAFKGQVQCDKPGKKLEKSGGDCDHDEDQGKSFGYKLGKSLAFRANRFNQFWSVNKMRYMNLACLLMTLVCLCTILLFSKSKLVNIRSEVLPAQNQRAGAFASPLVSGADRQRSRIGSDSDQDVGDQADSRGNAIEFIIRQQPSNKVATDKADDQTESEMSASSDPEEQVVTTRPSHSDGFNLFDERHDQQDQDQDSLIQEARKQLKRQQETELEMEDESGTPPSGGGQSRPSVLVSVQRSRPIPFLQDPINQVLQDLDGFGLFKSIRSRLAEQLKQQNLTSRAPTVIRNKNGATIIMSFSQQGDSNSTATNETTPSSSPLVESMPSLLRDLLPPGVLEQGKRSPSGFAAIALDSQPRATVSFRSSNLPFGGAIFESSSSAASPFFGPASPFELPTLFMSPPPPLPLLSQKREQMTPPAGGLMSMLFRASRELAHQMRHQMEQAAAVAAAAATNRTSSGTSNDTTTKQAQASQQQVKVIQLDGGLTEQSKETLQQSNSTEPDTAADEIETFSTARFIGLPSRQQQQQQQQQESRSAAPRSMLMIESSSGMPSSLFGADGDKIQPPSPMLTPFPLMPSVFFMGPAGSGLARSSRAHPGPNPLLRSLIGSVVSDLTRSIALDGEPPAISRRPMSRSDEFVGNRDQDGDPSEWDEWSGETSDGPLGGANGPSQEGPIVRSPVSASAGSLFERMFEHLANDRQRSQASGATFKHTLRTPSGITIERIAGLPTGVQTVAPHVRSQSLSRLIESPSVESEMMGNRLARSRANLSQDDESDSGSSWRQLADEHRADSMPRRTMRARQSAIERMDSSQPSDFDQQDPFPARVRVASARIRLMSPPRVDSVGPLPFHFRLPASSEQSGDEPSDEAPPRRPSPSSSSAVFTSPNSPLFGFPALLRSESSTSSGSEQEINERGDNTHQTSGQRRQRSFVYHSNHELAKPNQAAGRRTAPQVVSSQHKQPPAELLSRSAADQQQHAAQLPPAAAVVMGRRLDDLVER